MRKIIKTRSELCIGCNRCVRECPMEMANVTYQDVHGAIKVKTDYAKCIVCGRCVAVCKHDARGYEDDTERFFNDLSAGTPISLIVAPSVRTNVPHWRKLFARLKTMGVGRIYDASLGADICVWAHIRHMEQNDPPPMITQPCPAIVSYCRKYRHDLLKSLSPVHSPMACISVYMRDYEGVSDRIAALSPCIAKSSEFDDTRLAQYNVTFKKLLEYLQKHDIKLSEAEAGFDHNESGLGALFPMPGGFGENIEYFMGKALGVSRAEGVEAYEMLDGYAQTPEESLPAIFDVLNCRDGCNMGSACSSAGNRFFVDRAMRNSRDKAMEGRRREHFRELHKSFDERFDLSRFMRRYEPIFLEFPRITGEDIENAFAQLDKDTREKQSVDCGACGCDTCRDMARRIALGVNIPMNCILKSINAAKAEHEINLNTLERLETIWGHVESGIAIIDAETRMVLDVNPAAVRLFGGDRDCMIGQKCYQFFGQHQCPIMDLNQSLDRAERQFAKADGSIITVLKSVSKIYYKGRLALLESFTDLSSFKEAEEKNKMLAMAEHASQAKSAFLANMSHEIRTPMNAILGITEIQLQNEALDPAIREALDKIHSSGDLLLGIINDILDLSKIEAGKLELTLGNYETASLINDAVQLNIMRLGSKPIAFELHVDENTPAVLTGDELRIKQILNNLLSNAMKYTEKGRVTLRVSVESGVWDDADVATLVLRVSDTGQGMTEEEVGRLFDEYSRFNQQANRMTEGTGLGMSITHNLVHMMNGEIAVTSRPGAGSEFTVRLPQGNVGSGVLGRELAENLSRFRQVGGSRMRKAQISREFMPYGSVLIVDDVGTNIYVAQGLLSPYGLKVDTAASGYEAIEKIRRGEVYDIVFMDHMMPGMDGLEATKIIRGMGYAQPIVALTANAVIGQADLFLENGFDDFISKPIDMRRMNAVLNKMVRDKQPPEVVEEARAQAAAKAENGKSVEKATPAAVDPRFAEFFVRDARNSLSALEAVVQRGGPLADDDLRTYVIHTHGMKSALANIGEAELSAVAKKLEAAGRENLRDVMDAETPGFLSALKALVEKLSPGKEDERPLAEDGDKTYLRGKLLAVKAACGEYDEKTAESALAELREKSWPPSTRKFLNKIAEHLLHCDFDEIAGLVETFLSAP